MFKHRPSPAAIIAVLALFVALSGSAVAARSYLITNTDQIKPSVLRKLKGQRGRKGPAGPQGIAGPQGPAGPAGPAATVAAVTEIQGPTNTILPGDAESSVAVCPAGSRVISGGGESITGDANGVAASEPSPDHTSWLVVGGNTSGINGSVQAFAYCGPSGQAVATGTTDAARERAESAADAIAERVAQAIQAGE
jgi:hypothetical protein